MNKKETLKNCSHVYGNNAYCKFEKSKNPEADLRDEFDFFTFENDETDDSGFRSLADIERIAELEAQTQWISVEDRLPETFQRVLALTTDCDLDPVHTLVHFNGVKTGFLSIGGKKDKDVTHWMPLPTPPVGGEL